MLFRSLRARGTTFLEAATRADDVWLNATAVEAGIPTYQIRRFPWAFPITPGSQVTALAYENVDAGGNQRADLRLAARRGADGGNDLRMPHGASL